VSGGGHRWFKGMPGRKPVTRDKTVINYYYYYYYYYYSNSINLQSTSNNYIKTTPTSSNTV
jgi:hypothetical protein